MNQRYKSDAVVPDGTKDPGFKEDAELYYQPMHLPGARLPHVWIEKGTQQLSTLDICGKGRFTRADRASAAAAGSRRRRRRRRRQASTSRPWRSGLAATTRTRSATGPMPARYQTAAASSCGRTSMLPGARRAFGQRYGRAHGRLLDDPRQEAHAPQMAAEKGEARWPRTSSTSPRKQSEEAVVSRMDPAKVDPRLYEVDDLAREASAWLHQGGRADQRRMDGRASSS